MAQIDSRVLLQSINPEPFDFDKEEANQMALQKERMAIDSARQKAAVQQRLSDILRGNQPVADPAQAGAREVQPSLNAILGRSGMVVPGYGGGMIDVRTQQRIDQPVEAEQPTTRRGGFDRFGGRSLKDIYAQLQQVDPAAADEWLEGQYKLDKAGLDVGKVEADTAKQWADVDSQTLENHAAETARAIELMRSVRDQASLNAVRQRLMAEGIDDVDDISEFYSPGLERQWSKRALTAYQSAQQELEERRISETQRHNRATEGVAAGNLDVRRQQEQRISSGGGGGASIELGGRRYVQQGGQWFEVGD